MKKELSRKLLGLGEIPPELSQFLLVYIRSCYTLGGSGTLNSLLALECSSYLARHALTDDLYPFGTDFIDVEFKDVH
ncbi:hypothetical protein EU538_03685 [Candidatus Thorarchaeota archaeon]|nr:MAG: hypothetical protein EU538_03685 [Candidatus Thorarchaeota archaeon]